MDRAGETATSGGRPGAGKRAYDPVRMRNRLLDVAAASFQARGYHATGMHEIMRMAGVTGGALYHHFPSKKALGLAVIRERVARAVTETWIEPLKSARRAGEGIRTVFAEVAAALEERGSVQGCPLNNLAHELALADPEFRTALVGVFENWRIAISEKLRSERRRDAESLATMVVATFSGAMSQAKAGQTAAPLAACAQQLLRMLAAGPRKAKR